VQTGRRYIVKRYWILLLTLGVVFVLAVPVAATPGDEAWCIDHRDHLKCVESPSEDPGPAFSTVCGGEVEDGTPFEVDLGGRKTDLLSSARVDVMSDGGAWVVEVEVLEGTLRGMSIFIRDSIGRGDGCFPGGSDGLVIRDIPEENPFTITMGMEAIPEAYVNACNVFEDDIYFGEWTDGVFYEDIQEEIPSPLAFVPAMSGTNDAEVKLIVSFPEYTD
jgi:hypothetical protein